MRSRLLAEFDLHVRRENESIEPGLTDAPAVLQRLTLEWVDQVLQDTGCEIKDFRDLWNKVSEV